MSTIKVTANEAVYKIEKFLGLNENPAGDTKLKLGQATKCQNWKVTRDWNLMKRPGSKTVSNTYSKAPVQGIWYGNVNGEEVGLVASGGVMWLFARNGEILDIPEILGELSTANRVNFFAYSNIVYILNGEEYYQYDGTAFGKVIGYRPLIITSRTPSGSQSTLLEEVNKLNGYRRVWFSPNGTDSVFQLPEQDLMSVDYVKINADGSYMSPDLYSSDKYAGTVTFGGAETFTGDGTTTVFVVANTTLTVSAVTVKVDDVTTSVTLAVNSTTGESEITFSSAPADESVIVVTETLIPKANTDSIEIGYQAVATYRPDVCRMTNAELFLGAQDNCVILYGNGTNEAIYSGIDYWGQPRADYFPDLHEIAVADANTPITGMIRHYSQLICFKSKSVYVIHFGLITTATGDQEFGFYVTPVNKEIGNAALGQVRLVLNSPFSLNGHDLYEWKSNSRYSVNLSADERNAVRISDRIYATLESFDAENCYCYDDNYGQEYYICYGNEQLVYDYPADAWYHYTGLNIYSMCNMGDKLLFGTDDGRICELSEQYLNDDGTVIDCVWESGSLDFSKNYMRKFMSELWISLKPIPHSKVTVTAQTDRKTDFTEKTIESRLSTFEHMDFDEFSFETNRKPQVKKIKLKAKKFAFLKLILKSKDLYSSAVVLSIDPKVRETGYVK